MKLRMRISNLTPDSVQYISHRWDREIFRSAKHLDHFFSDLCTGITAIAINTKITHKNRLLSNKMTKYAHLFFGPDRGFPRDQYLFCNVLGTGIAGVAQLVLRVGSNLPLVRKTISPRLRNQNEMNALDKITEISTLNYLNYQAADDQPMYINRMWDCEDIYPDQGEEGRPFRIMYLEYCNGGDLQTLYDRLMSRQQGMSRRLILRLVSQMLIGLNYLYTRQTPILHGDFHMGNIFLNWTAPGEVTFNIGDFGSSVVSPTVDCKFDLARLKDWLKRIVALPGPRAGAAQDTAAIETILTAITAEVDRLTHRDMPEDVMPDMTALMALVAQIPAEGAVADPWREYNPYRGDVSTANPMYYDTREECLQPHMRGTAVHGPWYIAQVSPYGAGMSDMVVDDGDVRVQMTLAVNDGSGNAPPPPPPGPRVLGWELEWYHRPSTDGPADNSFVVDESDEFGSLPSDISSGSGSW